MDGLTTARRTGMFVRSILPAEPAHWLLLVGATFLFIARYLRWWPAAGLTGPRPYVWAGVVTALSVPMLVGGCVGYYLALFPCKGPVRRLATAVLLPSLTTLSAISVMALLWFRVPGEPAHSILEPLTQTILETWNMVLRLPSNLGPGFQFAAGGVLLVAIFTWLVLWGRTSLPVRLSSSPASSLGAAEPEEGNRRVMLFIWMMICLVPLTSVFNGAVALAVLGIGGNRVASSEAWVVWLVQLSEAAALLILVLFALGKSGRKSVPQTLRIPPAQYLGLAAILPAALVGIWPMIYYCRDRISWAANEWGKYPPPYLGSYLQLPSVLALWYLVPAFVEEIGWRGYLQPRLVHRYGVFRGILFVGIAWGAFHFSGDFHAYLTTGGVFLVMLRRLGATIAYSYVLAWLTIASRSVVPAAVAHATLNVFVFYPMPVHAPFWAFIALWAIVGYVLFRYFPPQLFDEGRDSDSPPASESAF